jgi:hypothetical protein
VTDGIWTARRSDNPTRILTADTAPELRWLLRADHGSNCAPEPEPPGSPYRHAAQCRRQGNCNMSVMAGGR